MCQMLIHIYLLVKAVFIVFVLFPFLSLFFLHHTGIISMIRSTINTAVQARRATVRRLFSR